MDEKKPDEKKPDVKKPDEKKAAPAPAAAVAVPEAAPATPPPGPLKLKRGCSIQIGARQGTVDQIRGHGKKPYDVRVKWVGEKYPQFITFRTLELDHETGRLKVL